VHQAPAVPDAGEGELWLTYAPQHLHPAPTEARASRNGEGDAQAYLKKIET
jgi:hypothetical protein